jgi:hypothetical protein
MTTIPIRFHDHKHKDSVKKWLENNVEADCWQLISWGSHDKELLFTRDHDAILFCLMFT